MSKHIEMRRGPQETKTVLFDSADIKPIYYPLLLVLRSHLLTFRPYFFISFNYLHSLYSSTDFNALHPLDSFYSGKQQRVDRIYYLIQTVLPVDKKKKSLVDSSAWEKSFCRNEDGFCPEPFSQTQLSFEVSLFCPAAESSNQKTVSVSFIFSE